MKKYVSWKTRYYQLKGYVEGPLRLHEELETYNLTENEIRLLKTILKHANRLEGDAE